MIQTIDNHVLIVFYYIIMIIIMFAMSCIHFTHTQIIYINQKENTSIIVISFIYFYFYFLGSAKCPKMLFFSDGSTHPVQPRRILKSSL